MTTLAFALPDGTTEQVEVHALLNAGYAGREQSEVQAHIDELALLGIPGPETIPALYPVSPYLAQQTSEVPAQHGRTSGEAEWALVITENGPLLTAACDHTDRDLEVHGVAWSKNAGPDVLADRAWRLDDVRDHLDSLRLRAWVSHGQEDGSLIQDSPLSALLSPDYWLGVLRERGLDRPGTVLISGTVAMAEGVDQFADAWRVELSDPSTGESISLGYSVRRMPQPIG
ncbi:DUF2848 domain-containing protein [Arthrobacter sp.]|uniref:DUF2848 domain-containing protein n=1 Tax=Arthrobacter sp. TaxID=1667 RepID=UPI003A9320E1